MKIVSLTILLVGWFVGERVGWTWGLIGSMGDEVGSMGDGVGATGDPVGATGAGVGATGAIVGDLLPFFFLALFLLLADFLPFLLLLFFRLLDASISALTWEVATIAIAPSIG